MMYRQYHLVVALGVDFTGEREEVFITINITVINRWADWLLQETGS